jgi:hypothetical protein
MTRIPWLQSPALSLPTLCHAKPARRRLPSVRNHMNKERLHRTTDCAHVACTNVNAQERRGAESQNADPSFLMSCNSRGHRRLGRGREWELALPLRMQPTGEEAAV